MFLNFNSAVLPHCLVSHAFVPSIPDVPAADTCGIPADGPPDVNPDGESVLLPSVGSRYHPEQQKNLLTLTIKVTPKHKGSLNDVENSRVQLLIRNPSEVLLLNVVAEICSELQCSELTDILYHPTGRRIYGELIFQMFLMFLRRLPSVSVGGPVDVQWKYCPGSGTSTGMLDGWTCLQFCLRV